MGLSKRIIELWGIRRSGYLVFPSNCCWVRGWIAAVVVRGVIFSSVRKIAPSRGGICESYFIILLLR